MCVYVCVCSVPSPEDLEEDPIQQQPKSSYDSVFETQAEANKDLIAVEVSDEDVHRIGNS